MGAAGTAALKHLTLRQVASRSCCTDNTNVMLRSSWGRVTPQHCLRWSQLHWSSEFSSYLGLDCSVFPVSSALLAFFMVHINTDEHGWVQREELEGARAVESGAA